QTIVLRLEARAENLGIERVLEAVAHEGRVIVLDVHVEFADIADEEVHDLVVIGQLLPRQHHLIRAFLIELAQPRASCVRIHCRLSLDPNQQAFPICSKMSRTKTAAFVSVIVIFCLTSVPLSVTGPHRISLIEGSSTGDSRAMGRVRFLRAGLVTPLPGGLGIDPAGIMTGARGASLQARAMAKVTPLPAVSREARPGLSHGINLRGKRRGGAPRGERACARRAAAPAALSGGNI